jgi:hypothetical protein
MQPTLHPAGALKLNQKHVMKSSLHHQTTGCKVRTSIRAGGRSMNHNQTAVVHAAPAAQGLKVKSRVKAGGVRLNHNSTVAVR